MRSNQGWGRILALGVLVAACGGGGDNGGTGPTPSFTMSVSPTTLSLDVPTFLAAEGGDSAATAAEIIAAAATGNLTVNITRSGGFEGAVTVTVENLPNGVTAAPATIGAGATSATITLTVGASAAGGNSNVTVRGTGTGVTARTASVALTVVAPGGMSIALVANTMSIVQGGNGNTTVTINRTGSFTGAVNLTATGAPAGMVVAFDPTSATGASSQLTVTVGGSVATGSHPISIQGSGTGVPNSTVTLTVTVTAPAPAISLSLSQSSVAIQAGTSGSPGLTINRTNFTGAVTLGHTGAPAGMTVSFDPANTTGTSSTITVIVGTGVAAGNHDVTITGSGQGIAQASVVLTVTVIAAPTGIVTLSLSPNAVSLDAGTTTNVGMTINRTNFTGTVNLTATGAPTNMGISFNPASTAGNSSTITVSPGEDLAGGIYQIMIRANGTGIAEATAQLTVTVTVPPMGVTLNLSPTALSIQQGQNSNATVTITRTNYPGTVTLTQTGAPAGMSVGFNPTSTTANSSTITVTVGGGVAVGSYPIIIRANGSGISEASAQLTVTVTSSGGGGGSQVVMTFCAQTGQPLWLAAQSFGGAWAQVTGVGGTYTFNINTKGAVAYVVPSGFQTNLTVIYGSVADLNQAGSTQCTGSGATKTLNGTSQGVTALGMGSFAMGGASATRFASDGPFQLDGVRDGPQDLLGSLMSLVTGEIVKLYVNRNLNIADGGSVGTVDLAAALTPVARTATVNNRGSDAVSIASSFLSLNGSSILTAGSAPTQANTLPWGAFPNANVMDGEWHLQAITALPAAALNPFPYRSVSQFNKFSADRTYTLPPFLVTDPTVQVTGTAPYVTINSSWSIQSSDYDDFWTMTYNPVSGNVSAVTIMGSAGYFGGGPVQLNLPAFGAGFNAAWGLQPGVQTQWIFMANGGSAWSVGTGATPFEGAIANRAAVSGTITP